MKWQWWGVALLPLVVGLVLGVLFSSVTALPNPIVYLRANLNVLVFLVGTALSILAVLALVMRLTAERRRKRGLSELRTRTAEERRRFLQRLDHELKNPLTAIRAGLANVASDAMASEQQGALSSVETQVIRLSHLTADLRKLAELEVRTLDRMSIDAAELLQEVVALSQERAEAEVRQLSLVLPQAPWPLPNISGDWDLLFLAVHNLLENALKFTRPGDTIEVRAFEDGNMVVLEIADTGPGIPEDEVPRVWEELYRGREAQGIPGSGMGLALVRAIVERHDGRTALRSRLGQGTVVTVRLPIS